MQQYQSTQQTLWKTPLTHVLLEEGNLVSLPFVSLNWELHAKGNSGIQSTPLLKARVFHLQLDLSSFMETCWKTFSSPWQWQPDMTYKELRTLLKWQVLRDIETVLLTESLLTSSQLHLIPSRNLSQEPCVVTIPLVTSVSCRLTSMQEETLTFPLTPRLELSW